MGNALEDPLYFWKHRANSSASLDVPVQHNGPVGCFVYNLAVWMSIFTISLNHFESYVLFSCPLSLQFICWLLLYLYLLLICVGDKCAVVFLCVTKHPNSQSASTLFLMNSGQRALLAMQAWISEWSFNLCKCLSFLLELRNRGGDILKALKLWLESSCLETQMMLIYCAQMSSD